MIDDIRTPGWYYSAYLHLITYEDSYRLVWDSYLDGMYSRFGLYDKVEKRFMGPELERYSLTGEFRIDGRRLLTTSDGGI